MAAQFGRPSGDVLTHSNRTYTASASTVLRTTALTLAQSSNSPVRYAAVPSIKPKHGARYLAKVTAGMDFSEADQVDPAKFNQILWKGLTSDKPFKVKDGGKSDARIASAK